MAKHATFGGRPEKVRSSFAPRGKTFDYFKKEIYGTVVGKGRNIFVLSKRNTMKSPSLTPEYVAVN
jgi:hypothetical protein